jgi:hypothetical protein
MKAVGVHVAPSTRTLSPVSPSLLGLSDCHEFDGTLKCLSGRKPIEFQHSKSLDRYVESTGTFVRAQ